MVPVISPFADFFRLNFPTWQAFCLYGPSGVLWSFTSLWFAGYMKKRGMKTGYTRKIFHFLTFFTVALLHWLAGTQAVLVFGASCSLVVFYAVWQGNGNHFYEALAREKDAPHRTWFILVPWFTTLLGGVLSNVFFSEVVLAGYLIAGVGDAVGEPAGARFGSHFYRVWSRSSVPAFRSIEGSAAVLLASGLMTLLAISVIPQPAFHPGWGFRVLGIAAASALVEAFSPHGWDNLTMQVVPAFLVQIGMT